MQRIVIVGATSAIATACAHQWLRRGDAHLTLVGRDSAGLQRLAGDLAVRHPGSRFDLVPADLLAPASIAATLGRIAADGPIDIALVAHGWLPDQPRCQADLGECRQALEVNGVSPALWAEAIAGVLEPSRRARLAVIGSVAGDRGRRSNYAYGAAKALVATYLQGLQHRFAGTPVAIVLVKPGPTDTPMTAALKAQGRRLTSVDTVARIIVDGIDAGRPVVYAPRRWRLIMAIIRRLPDRVFHRLNI